MDRLIVYPGSIPLDTDLLNIQRNMLLGVGELAQCVLGTAPVADGLACVPWATGYGVSIGPGSLAGVSVVDAGAFGSLPPDATATVKAGFNRGSTDLALAPAADANSVVCWLIQAALQEQDTGPVALPYWNAANPAVAFSGPGNSGTAQNTQRVMRVALGSKSSGPTAVGSFVPPPPDPGWVGLYGVTVWSGKPGLGAGDIQVLASAPFLPFQLPQLTPGFSRQDLVTSTSQWQAPLGVRRVRVRLVGGGGGGGGSGTTFGGGGGGAGGYAESILVLQPGQAISVVVGAGGTAGAPGSTGGTGGTTGFGGLVMATGGPAAGPAPRIATVDQEEPGLRDRSCSRAAMAATVPPSPTCLQAMVGAAPLAAVGGARDWEDSRRTARRPGLGREAPMTGPSLAVSARMDLSLSNTDTRAR